MDYCFRELAGESLPEDHDFHQCPFLNNVNEPTVFPLHLRWTFHYLPKTKEEKTLKEEIEILKKDRENVSGKDVSDASGGEEANLRGLIESKERDLEILVRELEDKLRSW